MSEIHFQIFRASLMVHSILSSRRESDTLVTEMSSITTNNIAGVYSVEKKTEKSITLTMAEEGGQRSSAKQIHIDIF